MAKSVKNVADAAADGVLLSVGEAPHLQRLPGRNKAGLMLRVDPANFYNNDLPVSQLHCRVFDNAVEIALRLDAACILMNLLQIDEHPEMLSQCVENILKVKNDCDRYGMPLGIEPLSFKKVQSAYVGDGDPKRVTTLARMAAELGADIIKTDFDRARGGIPPGRRGGFGRSRHGSRRQPGFGCRGPGAHRTPRGTGCGRPDLRPQHHPARESGGDDSGRCRGYCMRA